jgi:hypothetical protein
MGCRMRERGGAAHARAPALAQMVAVAPHQAACTLHTVSHMIWGFSIQESVQIP